METEKRLIYADEVVRRLMLRKRYGLETNVFAAIDLVDNVPTVDAVEVVHGRWIHSDLAKHWRGRDECGVCGFRDKDRRDLSHYTYCPNCGAKMDGGDKNGC